MDRYHHRSDGGRAPAGARLLGLGVSLLACAPSEREDYDLAGEHIGFHFENDDRELCAGSVPHLDRYIERVFEFFGSAVPQGYVASVHVGQDPPCSHHACYRYDREIVYVSKLDGSGYQTGGVLRHELTHALIDRVWGRSASFFEEGLAESFSRTFTRQFLGPPPSPTAVGAILGEPAEAIDYTAAALFTRFLIDTRGLARFKRLFQGAKDLTGVQIEELIAETYGESFDAIEAEFLSGEPRCQYDLDLCDPSTAEAITSTWSADVPASCSDPYFYGSRGADDMTIAGQRTLWIDASGTYRVSVGFEWLPFTPKLSEALILLHRCGACDQRFVRPFSDRNTSDLELEAGLYIFEILMPFETVVSLELHRLEGAP